MNVHFAEFYLTATLSQYHILNKHFISQHPPHCPSGGFIVIRPGDTLYSIARRFNVSVDALLAANPGVNPDFLQIGQQICVPTLPTPTITCPGPTYTVRRGDTLFSLARILGTSVQAILAANPGINPQFLEVGPMFTGRWYRPLP